MSESPSANIADATDVADPVAEVVTQLHPVPGRCKIVEAAGLWSVRREGHGAPFYTAVLEGRARIAVDGLETVALEVGDFLLVPATQAFTVGSEPFGPERHHWGPAGESRHGTPGAPIDYRALIGTCAFASPDAALLLSLLPTRVVVRGADRLSRLLALVVDESRADRPGRDVVLARLIEVLFIEALRSDASIAASPGLLRGLADPRLAATLRAMHATPAHAWTVVELARLAGMSRSSYFAGFRQAVGLTPMQYLLAWRMALAQRLLRSPEKLSVAQVAERVGYGSASTFSTAFSRHLGIAPSHFGSRTAGSE